MIWYHTALARKNAILEDVWETTFYRHTKGVMIKNDIIESGLPAEFDSCDVLYAEPPWPHGFKIFNKRAGVEGSTYQQLSDAITKIIEQGKPTYICLGKTLVAKLPKPQELHDVILNGDKIMLGIWNDSHPSAEKPESTNKVCAKLGLRYAEMGDFFCGYGECVRNFLDGGGQKFVASDFDGKCITVMARKMLKYQ